MKTIYNTYVEMESQEQCDRMKQLCIYNGLPIWGYSRAFEICREKSYFGFKDEFAVFSTYLEGEIEITEQEFIKLLQDERN
jgi:hypothetical protein